MKYKNDYLIFILPNPVLILECMFASHIIFFTLKVVPHPLHFSFHLKGIHCSYTNLII